MKRLLSFLPAVLVGLLIGWLINRFRESAPAISPQINAAQPASPNSPNADWKSLLAARAPAVSYPSSGDAEVCNSFTSIVKTHVHSPVRAEVETELFRQSLPAENLTWTALVGEGDSGALTPPTLPQGREEMLSRLAKVDPLKALKMVDSLDSQPTHDHSLRQLVMKEWLKQDPTAALAYVRKTGTDYEKGQNLSLLLEAWTKLDPAAAAAALTTQFPKPPAEYLSKFWVTAALEALHTKDPAAARQWITTVPEEATRQALTLEADELDAKSPAAKASLMLDNFVKNPENATSNMKLGMAMADWLSEAPEAAVQKLLTIPADAPFWHHDAEEIGTQWAMSQAANLQPEAFLQTLAQVPAGPQRNALLAGLVHMGASNNIPFAVRILTEMTEGRAREQAYSSLTELWLRSDPLQVSQWLAAQPASPSRHAGVTRLAELLVKSDPEAAQKWAETLPADSLRRKEVLDRIPPF